MLKKFKWKLTRFLVMVIFLIGLVLLLFPSGSTADAVLTGYVSTLSISGNKEVFKRQFENKQSASLSAPNAGPGEFIFPFKEGEGVWGNTNQSPPGIRIHPIYGTIKLHRGYDLSAVDNTDMYAICDGTVLHERHDITRNNNRNDNDGAGNWVVIQSGDLKITYMHMNWGSKAGLVKVGDEVKAGQLIGAVGSTGASTGPHLHLQVESIDGRYFSARDLIEKKIPISEADYFTTAGVWYNYKGEQIGRKLGN